jgi:hypothetical protein
VTFKLVLHPWSPSSIFFAHDDPEEEYDYTTDSDVEQRPSLPPSYCLPFWRKKRNHLRPGEEYHERLRTGKLFVFGTAVQERRKGEE